MSEMETQTGDVETQNGPITSQETGVDTATASEKADHVGALSAPPSVREGNTAGSEGAEETTLPQALQRINRVETALRNLFQLQQQTKQKLGTRQNESEKMLLDQIAELETKSQIEMRKAEIRNAQQTAALAARVEAAEAAGAEAGRRVAAIEARAEREQAQQSVYQQAWQVAPLTLRLKFVRELLPESHGLQSVLKETEALEALRLRGRDLENWLTNYPSLFADAAQTLEVSESGAGSDSSETHTAHALAVQTLADARKTLETTLQALGITWVAPAPGEPITAEHEVVGEEAASQETGRIARLRRRGFRIQGRLALPAQVFRAVAAGATPNVMPLLPVNGTTKEEEKPGERSLPGIGVTPPAPSLPTRPVSASNQDGLETGQETARQRQDGTGATGVGRDGDASEEIPDWLRRLRQRFFGCDQPAVCALAEQMSALIALPAQITEGGETAETREALIRAVQPLLPLMGLRYADGIPDIPAEWGAILMDLRDPLLDWLKEAVGLCVLSSSRGAPFDPKTMEAVETRRTAHAQEENTVAKMERIGLLWQDRPLLRVQVVRYIAREGA